MFDRMDRAKTFSVHEIIRIIYIYYTFGGSSFYYFVNDFLFSFVSGNCPSYLFVRILKC